MVAFKVMEILKMKVILMPAGMCYKQNLIDLSRDGKNDSDEDIASSSLSVTMIFPLCK
jgi:hypothetical protein